jgi:pimeloyl-ACP methyl ester carboxylesterase
MRRKSAAFCVLILLSASYCGGAEKLPEHPNNVNVSQPGSDSFVSKKYIDIGQIYTYYEIAGKGEPVILIHAYSLDCQMWDAQFNELAKHYQVVRYDMRGYGKTDMPVEGLNFSHAQDLRKLMWFLGIPKAHLVGVSLGASVAVDFMTLYPEKVLSVTAVAGGIRESVMNPQQERQRKLALIESVKKQGIGAYKKQWLEMMMSVCGPNKDEIRPQIEQMVNAWSGWQVLYIEPPWELNPPVAEQLKTKKPDVPVLVVIGKYDAQRSIRSGELLAEILPKAKKVYFEDAGHFPNMETPAEFNKTLSEFLSSVENAKSEK